MDAQPETYKYTLLQSEIESILKGLKNGKVAGMNETTNEMLKYGRCQKLIEILHNIFITIINARVMPDRFNIGIIKPIVKNSSIDPDEISNLRPIMLSDPLANILEIILMREINKHLIDNNKQFGFKSNSSCAHAVGVLNMCLTTNKCSNRTVYACAIDASKAFDKVNMNLLWCKLSKRLPPFIVNTLINYYSKSEALVENNGLRTLSFTTSVGVKQGGPLSPRLFSLYIEDLIPKIESINTGAKLIHSKVDIILYADDILLLSNELTGLQKMLIVTEEYGNEFEIKFNPSKTTYMVFGPEKKKRNEGLPKFEGECIGRVDSLKYLGCHITKKLSSEMHVNKKRQATNIRIAALKRSVLRNDTTQVRIATQIYKTYCRPILLYGCEAMRINLTQQHKIQTTESNAIKNALKINKFTKSTALLTALGLDTIQNRLLINSCNFICRLSKNSYVKNILDELILNKAKASVKNNQKSLINQLEKRMNQSFNNTDYAVKCCQDTLLKLNKQFKETQKGHTVQAIKNLIGTEINSSNRKKLNEMLDYRKHTKPNTKQK